MISLICKVEFITTEDERKALLLEASLIKEIKPKFNILLKDDKTIWEQEPLERLAADGQLASFEHEGFWHPMDTLRDKNVLESLWDSGSAPWKKW